MLSKCILEAEGRQRASQPWAGIQWVPVYLPGLLVPPWDLPFFPLLHSDLTPCTHTLGDQFRTGHLMHVAPESLPRAFGVGPEKEKASHSLHVTMTWTPYVFCVEKSLMTPVTLEPLGSVRQSYILIIKSPSSPLFFD